MPLLKRKSKQALKHNIEEEIEAGKPKEQALAIAYDMQRRSRKGYVKGGKVSAPEGYKGRTHYFDTDEGPEGILPPKAKRGEKKDRDLQKTSSIRNELYARKQAKSVQPDESLELPEGLLDSVSPPKLQKKLQKLAFGDIVQSVSNAFTDKPKVDPGAHARNLAADKPKPTGADPSRSASENKVKSLPGFNAEGGEIKMKPKMQPKAYPKMTPSSVIKAKHLDAYGRLTEDEKDLEQSAHPNNGPQRQPDEFMDEEGADRQGPEIKDEARQHNNGRKAYASGGSIQPQPEAEEARHDSLAAAIMAKRGLRKMMAEGGEATLKENYTEQPNGFYPENEHEALEFEAADVPMPSQPEDSNEHGDDIDSDEHDHIERMRRKMKARKQF